MEETSSFKTKITKKLKSPEYKKIRNRIFSVLRIVISSGLLYFLIRNQIDDFSLAIQITKTANLVFLIISFSIYFFSIWIIAVRWKTLLKTQNISYSTNYLFSSVLIGFFFNNFLPTTIGGDVYRALDTSKAKNSSLAKSTSVIIMERSTGIISAVTYLIAALFLGFTQIRAEPIVLPIIIIFMFSMFFIFILLFPEKLKLDTFFKKIKFLHKFKDKLKTAYDTFRSFKKYKAALIKAIFLSFVLQFFLILNYYFCSLALGIDLNLLSFIFIVPMVATIAMIPITVGGIGLRENSLVFLMVSLGASNYKSTIVSLLLFLMLLIPGIIGGVIYAIRPYIRKRLENNSKV